MTDLRKAAEMALKALEAINEMSKPPMNIPLDAEIDDAMDALRQALQRPVKSYTNNSPQYATDDRYTKPQNVYTSEERVHEIDIRKAAEMALEALEGASERALFEFPGHFEYEGEIKALHAALAQPEQAPVLWKWSGDGWSYEKPIFPATPLYAAPPSKPWVSLSDSEIARAANICGGDPMKEFARAIEAALKEKNHD